VCHTFSFLFTNTVPEIKIPGGPSFPELSRLGGVSAAGPLLHLLATVISFRCAVETTTEASLRPLIQLQQLQKAGQAPYFIRRTA